MRARFLYAPAILLACFVAGPVLATDPAPAPTPVVVTLTITGPTSVAVGQKCVLSVDTSAKKVTWRLPAGCDTLAIDGKTLAVWAGPGTYSFTAMVPSGDDVATKDYTLTVTGSVPVVPVDVLAAAVQAAYTADTSTSKAADAAALAAVYKAIASQTNATSIKTAADLFTVIQSSSASIVGTRLPTVRSAIGADLGKYMPTSATAVLTQQNRDDAAAALLRYAGILAGVK